VRAEAADKKKRKREIERKQTKKEVYHTLTRPGRLERLAAVLMKRTVIFATT
jgi:hypothetical protein